jgi:hypothetical protein
VNYVLDLLQGAGIALACGIHPLLPVLLVGGLASANLGVNFDGTDFAFLEQGWFLLIVAAALVVSVLFRARLETRAGQAAWGGLAIGFGAVEAAGSIADGYSTWWPGLLVGAACAAMSFAVTSAVLARTRARLDPQAAAALPLYAGGASLLVAGLSVLLPPLALLAGGFIGWLRAAGRRREGQKYAGLRILK